MPICAVELTVEGPGTAPVAVRVPAPSSQSDGPRWIEIALQPEARLRGRLLSESRAPASEARITARIQRLADSEAKPALRTVATDTDGRFELGGLGASEIWLAIEALDTTPASGGTVLLVERLAAGESRQLTAKLSAPAAISGRIEYPDGAPAPGVRLEAIAVHEGVRFGFHASAMSTPDGSFSLRPLAQGAVSLQVGSAWYGVLPGAKPEVGRLQQLGLRAGEHRTGIVFTVPRAGAEFGGAVVDADGRPVAGAAVDAYVEDAHGSQVDFQARVFADEVGRVVFSDLLQGSYQVRATHPTLGSASAYRIVPGAGRFVLQLQPPDTKTRLAPSRP